MFGGQGNIEAGTHSVNIPLRATRTPDSPGRFRISMPCYPFLNLDVFAHSNAFYKDLTSGKYTCNRWGLYWELSFT